MFIIRYFKWGFQFPKLLTHTSEKLWKTFLYFMLLVLITNFPLTWLAYNEQGSKLDFIEQDFIDETPEWNLPSGKIATGKLMMTETNVSRTHGDIIYVFNYTSDTFDTSIKSILLKEDYIIFTDGEGNFLQTDGYYGFEVAVFDFDSVNLLTDDERALAFQQFGHGLEKSFSTYIIFYTVLRNTLVQIGATFIFVLLLACIIQLFRFGFANFMTFKEGINFVILSSTLPSILALISGFLLPGFASVVFNLGLGLVVMLVLLVFLRKTYS